MPDTSHGMNSFFYKPKIIFKIHADIWGAVWHSLFYLNFVIFRVYLFNFKEKRKKKRTESHPCDSMYKLSEYFSASFNLQFD